MSRRRDARGRHREHGGTSTDARPLTPVERDRLRQRYAHLAGRALVMGYASLGIVVRAATPSEMVEATDAVIAEATRGQQPS